jgi:hypothetical protein
MCVGKRAKPDGEFMFGIMDTSLPDGEFVFGIMDTSL